MKPWPALPLILFAAARLSAQSEGEDEYTRYELLAPETASFRILYDVTASTAGALFFFNPIRKGSVARDESVIDLATGRPLEFEVVSGTAAREAGQDNADPETEYIRVRLPRPVPAEGEIRIRIDKTYEDKKSYFREGDRIVFDRALGIRKNAVVLPAGYELVSLNVPSQVLSEPDGRIMVSFINTYPGSAGLVLKARPLTRPAQAPAAPGSASASSPSGGPALADAPVPERAREETEIVYFLQQPETHSFRLYHDFTREARRRRQISQRRACGKQGLGSVCTGARHGREALDRDPARAANRKSRTRGPADISRHRGRRRPICSGQERPVAQAPHRGDLHRP